MIEDENDANSLLDALSYSEQAKLYYSLENALCVSPHGLRKKMDAGQNEYILIDLRSEVEFRRAHIKGAANVPAYRDPETPVYHEEARIVEQFKSLPAGKKIIVYCYSRYCMSGKKIAFMLAKQSIPVQHLAIGWNEWRYSPRDWNHEHEWEHLDISRYIETSDCDTPTKVPKLKSIDCDC